MFEEIIFPPTLLPELSVACSTGNKSALKKLISTLPSKALEQKDRRGRTPLILSVVNDHPDCVSLLLKNGVQVDNNDNRGQTALHAAAAKGFSKCVKHLLKYKASLQHRDFDGITPIHYAAVSPNLKCLSRILKKLKPGEIDLQDATQKTPLHWSATYACLEHIKKLLARDAHICIPDKDGKTPLHFVVLNKKAEALDIVKILVNHESTLINWQDYGGRSALHLAVSSGSIEIVHYLVSKETCNPDVLDNSFCTPLHWAAKRGLWEKANLLLSQRAIPTSVDANGATPLHYAAYINHVKTVQVFLSRKFIHDVGDFEGKTALIWAAARNSVNVLNYMAAKGVNLKAVDQAGSTALHIATIMNNAPAVTTLLKLETPPDILDGNFMTPLLRACEFGRAKSAQILLEYGANLYALDFYGRSSLHWCALGGHANLCQILILKGSLCNTTDKFGMVPLHYASMHGDFVNCVSVLLESTADPNIIDKEGKSPLHVAVLNNRLNVAKLLCLYDAEVNIMARIDGWVTPLDLAVKNKNRKMIDLLKSYNAFETSEFRKQAVLVIEAWYLRVKWRKNRKKWRSKCYFLRKEKLAFPKRKFVAVLEADACTCYVSHDGKLCIDCTSGVHIGPCTLFVDMIAQIQRAWRRYSMRKKFERTRKDIQAFFESEEARRKAEMQWKRKIKKFCRLYKL